MKYAVMTGVTVQLDSDGTGSIIAENVIVQSINTSYNAARNFLAVQLVGRPNVSIIPIEES